MCSLRQPECVCSSVDRAMPSGGMCGGSTPLRRFRHIPGGYIYDKRNKCAYRKREGIKWIPEEKANIQNQVI